MKNKTKQFIADKFAEKWIKENKELLADYQEICTDLFMFRAKWGIEIGFIFKNAEEIKGRELGKGIVEEMFDAQKTIEAIDKYSLSKFETEKVVKKRFFNFFKLWYSDPFNKYVDEHPEFLDTKDIVLRVNKAYPKVAKMAQYPVGDINLRSFDEANPEKVIKTKSKS